MLWNTRLSTATRVGFVVPLSVVSTVFKWEDGIISVPFYRYLFTINSKFCPQIAGSFDMQACQPVVVNYPSPVTARVHSTRIIEVDRVLVAAGTGNGSTVNRGQNESR